MPFIATESPSLRTPVQQIVGASIFDLDSGLVVLRLETKLNLINHAIGDLLETALDRAEQANTGLLLTHAGLNFSAGADIRDFLAALQQGNWAEIERMEATFQGRMLRLKYARVPVVACISGICWGAGCEMALQTARQFVLPEWIPGLVEASVGLFPAGMGTTTLALRAYQRAAAADTKALPDIIAVWELLRRAASASSASDAVCLGLFAAESVSICADSATAWAEANAWIVSENRAAWPRRQEPAVQVLGKAGLSALQAIAAAEYARGELTAFAAELAEHIAIVLCGGAVEAGTWLEEAEFLRLERDLFLAQCQDPRTLALLQARLESSKAPRT